MPKKIRRTVALTTIILASLGSVLITLFPYLPPASSLPVKPAILYYDYENLPFNTSQFPTIVQTTLQHHFNTLMVLVYFDHRLLFNQSTLDYFYSYARTENLTFVPSYYVESLSDKFNVSGFSWVNLDMEKIAPNVQRFVYAETQAQGSPLVSITSPYGQPVEFGTSLDILETYSGTPWFWFLQLGYWHAGHICSIAPWTLRSQQEYDSEKNYCTKYTEGLMVFDYYNLLKSHLN